MPTNLLDVTVFTVGTFSYAVYAVYLKTLYNFRNKEPFSQSFFKMLFHIGIFDMLMMTERQLLYRFPGRGWLGMDDLVMTAPRLFAKLHVILFWYLVKPQVLGTLLLTVNRFMAIVFNHVWTERQTTYLLIAIWLMPLPFNIPLWNQGFHYVNMSGGGVLLFYDDKQFQWYYMVTCFIQCVLLVVAGVVCYSWIFIFSSRASKRIGDRRRSSSSSSNNKANFNILFIGIVLTVLTFECAIACGMMAYGTDPVTLKAILPWFDVGTELYCWINPYCLLVTSSNVRKHFWATLTCSKVQLVGPKIVASALTSTPQLNRKGKQANVRPATAATQQQDESQI